MYLGNGDTVESRYFLRACLEDRAKSVVGPWLWLLFDYSIKFKFFKVPFKDFADLSRTPFPRIIAQ